MTDGDRLGDFRTFRDSAGRSFDYAVVRHTGATGLVVHFSAFFMATASLPRAHRAAFSGYFHRLRMLGTDTKHDWLFLCDQYGAERDGCYYAGEMGDLFVERAMDEIIDRVEGELGVTPKSMVMIGSSMGATAALKFGLRRGVAGIVAISPHIDLDICAETQGRWEHVAFICPDGLPTAPHNRPYTRSVRNELEKLMSPPPRLFMQACADDRGVYDEQVLPLVDAWRAKGGRVDLDVRPRGGHTSAWAVRPLLLDVVDRFFSDRDLPIADYQTDDVYRGQTATPPLRARVRARAGTLRRRLRELRGR